MIRIGNFFFHYRNGLFPAVYALLFVKSSPVWPSSLWGPVAIGLAVALAGQLLRFVTIGLEYIVRGGRDRRVYAENLVQGGMFSHSRNPLYLGNFLILVGVGIASNSLLFLGVAIPFFIFAYAAIIAAEENFLRGKFGAEFDAYCAKVNRILPNFSGFGQTVHGMRFNWRRVITAEYGSTYIWLVAIAVVTLKNIWFSHGSLAGQPAATAMWIWLGVATAGYITARVLKKGRFLAPHARSSSYSET